MDGPIPSLGQPGHGGRCEVTAGRFRPAEASLGRAQQQRGAVGAVVDEVRQSGRWGGNTGREPTGRSGKCGKRHDRLKQWCRNADRISRRVRRSGRPFRHRGKTAEVHTCKYCAPGRIRTCDQEIRRLLLYPLSYGGDLTIILRSGRGLSTGYPTGPGTSREDTKKINEKSFHEFASKPRAPEVEGV